MSTKLNTAFLLLVVTILTFFVCIVIEDSLDIRLHQVFFSVKALNPVLVFENCSKIPKAPNGFQWPEEKYILDPIVNDIWDLANPNNSIMSVKGSSVVELGSTIRIGIQLYDGYNQRITRGGDLIRVWMKEPSVGASTVADVVDHGNGSYSAFLTAFWVGKPQVVAAIISSRQVIATVFRRRYICPPVLMNTAYFKHPTEETVTEFTPCSFDAQVPGYDELCNFTRENFQRPWYCGKPRHPSLFCDDWSLAADVNLWDTGEENKRLSDVEKEILSLKYNSRRFTSTLSLEVLNNTSTSGTVKPALLCYNLNSTHTWHARTPTGYMYGRRWFSKDCLSSVTWQNMATCVRNKQMYFIGDSTSYQLFNEFKNMFPCKSYAESLRTSRHRPQVCVNETLNFKMSLALHSLPFCTHMTPRRNFKSVSAVLSDVPKAEGIIVVIHMYAHFLNYHSHVFYETIKDLKMAITDFLTNNPKASVFIKGPHAYSFAKPSNRVMWMPDKYADIYNDLIKTEFKEISNNVFYLDALDITVATEQFHIHVEDYIVDELIFKMMGHICS